jgi:hypothetical protein
MIKGLRRSSGSLNPLILSRPKGYIDRTDDVDKKCGIGNRGNSGKDDLRGT